jgi:hypothetical protein
MDQMDQPGGLVIGGKHYRLGSEYEGSGAFKGHGGARFVIETADGTRVVTTNLWYQGEVPEHFRDRLPDNARFVEE